MFVSVRDRIGKRENLSHYLPSIEEHFVSFSEAVVRHPRLLFTWRIQKQNAFQEKTDFPTEPYDQIAQH